MLKWLISKIPRSPQFDGTNYGYWKAKMTTHVKSINRKIWQVVETKFEVANPAQPTMAEEEKLQNNGIALSAIHDVMDERVFEQIKNLEIAHDAWKKLEELYEDTQAVKSAKAYIFKEKFTSFKTKKDESVSEMFHRLQVLVVGVPYQPNPTVN
jgi:hypothetical protein